MPETITEQEHDGVTSAAEQTEESLHSKEQSSSEQTAAEQDTETVAEQDAEGNDEEAQPVPSLEGSVGLGVDLVNIERMKCILGRTPRFSVRVYTEEERSYCESTTQPHIHYATRFAAKEAVLKALGTGFACGIAPADVEVFRNQYGRPAVKLYRRAKEVAQKQGVREIPVSLSYTHTEAVACAMAITAESVRVAEERVDPMEELAKQFKDARSMLDDLPVRNEFGQTTGSLPNLTDQPDQAEDNNQPSLFEQSDKSEQVEESNQAEEALQDTAPGNTDQPEHAVQDAAADITDQSESLEQFDEGTAE